MCYIPLFAAVTVRERRRPMCRVRTSVVIFPETCEVGNKSWRGHPWPSCDCILPWAGKHGWIMCGEIQGRGRCVVLRNEWRGTWALS